MLVMYELQSLFALVILAAILGLAFWVQRYIKNKLIRDKRIKKGVVLG